MQPALLPKAGHEGECLKAFLHLLLLYHTDMAIAVVCNKQGLVHNVVSAVDCLNGHGKRRCCDKPILDRARLDIIKVDNKLHM